MLEEGTRQAKLDPNNSDEVAISNAMHTFFVDEVFPSIATNDWVYAAALEFAERYAIESIQHWKQNGAMVFQAQTRLLELKESVLDFIARANLVGAVKKQKLKLVEDKISNFIKVIKLYVLSPEMRMEALALHQQTQRHELNQLYVVTESIQNLYAKVLPRIMHVLRRVIKGRVTTAEQHKYEGLRDISEILDWYEANIDNSHPLAPVITNLRGFYRVIRNAASHPDDFAWEPDNDRVVFKDGNSILSMHPRELMQSNRILVYLCEFAFRGICAAFCEREQGPLANNLAHEYERIFPEGFPDGESVIIERYMSS
jgi:hypothetical protein